MSTVSNLRPECQTKQNLVNNNTDSTCIFIGKKMLLHLQFRPSDVISLFLLLWWNVFLLVKQCLYLISDLTVQYVKQAMLGLSGLSRPQRLVLGVVVLFVVNIIWVASSELTKVRHWKSFLKNLLKFEAVFFLQQYQLVSWESPWHSG